VNQTPRTYWLCTSERKPSCTISKHEKARETTCRLAWFQWAMLPDYRFRHSTSLKKLKIISASLVAVLLLENRPAMASRRGQWFIISAPSRRRISRLDDINIRGNQLISGIILKLTMDLRSALTKVHLYSGTL